LLGWENNTEKAIQQSATEKKGRGIDVSLSIREKKSHLERKG